MKLRDISIGRQLRIGMAAIVTFVAFLGVAAWYEAESLWQNTRAFYEHPFTVRQAIDQLAIDIISMHRDMKDAVLADEERARNKAIGRMDVREADAMRQFDILYSRYLGSRSDVDALRDAFVGWHALREETIGLLREGRKAEAARRTQEGGAGGAHVEKMLGGVNKISDFARIRAEGFYADARKHKEELLLWLVTISGALFLLTLGIGYGLFRNIREPLRELTATAERFRRGEVEARSRQGGANEFGALAASFNAMAEAIQGEWQRQEAAAGIAAVMLREEELHAFCRGLLRALLERTGSQIGAVYLLNDRQTDFDHFESIGLSPAGRASFCATWLEGEFGAALSTGQIQHLREIPETARFTFAAVSGDFHPREIITIPVPGKANVVAVISLASVRGYPEPVVRLVRDLWAVLTSRFNGVLASEKIRNLADRLDQQNQELQVQQEELEAQAEELRKQTEELQQQNGELERQRRRLQESGRLKSQFLSNMSHELRTPLNSVLALSRVLVMQAGGKLNPEEIGYLEIIERNGRNLLTLINDILDLSKIEAGRMPVRPKPFALREVLENVMEGLAPLAREKGILLCREIPEELPRLESDEIRVTQILQNLIGNAVKFTPAGSVTVSASAGSERVSIGVADTGIGIAPQDLSVIFDEFRQVDGSSSRRHEGTGLGLAIADKAARMLGGDISVVSTPGQGSLFTLNLPLKWPGEPPVPGPALPPGPSAAPSARGTVLAADDDAGTAEKGRRILIVEDNEAAIIQIRTVVESAGYRAAVARGGQAAIDEVARTRPDGIVLDLMMPDVDGFAVLDRIRASAATRHIPVLILTAKDLTPEELRKLRDRNIRHLIQKGDIERESLLEKIRSLLGSDREQGDGFRSDPEAFASRIDFWPKR